MTRVKPIRWAYRFSTKPCILTVLRQKSTELYPSVKQQGLELPRGTTTKSSRHEPAPAKNWEKCVDSSRKIHFFNYSNSLGIHFKNFINSVGVLERFFACFKSTVRTKVISKRILSLNPCKMAIFTWLLQCTCINLQIKFIDHAAVFERGFHRKRLRTLKILSFSVEIFKSPSWISSYNFWLDVTNDQVLKLQFSKEISSPTFVAQLF